MTPDPMNEPTTARAAVEATSHERSRLAAYQAPTLLALDLTQTEGSVAGPDDGIGGNGFS